MKNTRSEKAAQIMRHYGADKQLTILCEECAELIQAACKCRRKAGQEIKEDRKRVICAKCQFIG